MTAPTAKRPPKQPVGWRVSLRFTCACGLTWNRRHTRIETILHSPVRHMLKSYARRVWAADGKTPLTVTAQTDARCRCGQTATYAEFTPPPLPCTADCYFATGPTCTHSCRCGGEHHGAGRRR